MMVKVDWQRMRVRVRCLMQMLEMMLMLRLLMTMMMMTTTPVLAFGCVGCRFGRARPGRRCQV